MHKHFGVATAAKLMAELQQFLAQRLEVVNLAVEYQPDATIFIGHRLSGGRGEVDDPEAAMRQANMLPKPDRAFVGPAMKQRLLHRAQSRLFDGTAIVNQSGYATHGAPMEEVREPRTPARVMIELKFSTQRAGETSRSSQSRPAVPGRRARAGSFEG